MHCGARNGFISYLIYRLNISNVNGIAAGDISTKEIR
jgi:hypothetical protein